MSKVISFSISDKYLEKLRTLYPSLTDNLAAKQFLTDRLDDNLDAKLDDGIKSIIESSLSSSLDERLDGILDDKVKSFIESALDGLLDERLDDAVKKSITSLSERMARLEERLDDSLDGRLDDIMEQLLRLQREASIASPIPTIEETSPRDEPGEDAIEDSQKKILETVGGSESLNTLPVPLIADKTIDQNAIETLTGEPVTGEGMNAAQAYRYLAQKKVEVSERTLSNWVKSKGIAMTNKGDKVSEYLILRDKLYYPID